MIDPIIILSGHTWAGVPYGLHHIAGALAAKGAEVLFVEPPFSPFHLAANRRRARKMTWRPRQSDLPGIKLFSPFTLLPLNSAPVFRSATVLDQWQKFSVNNFKSAIRSTSFERPGLVICGTALFSTTAFSINTRCRAFRLADDECLFAAVPRSVVTRTESDFPRYDVVLATTKALAEFALSKGAKRTILLPNGYDPSRFAVTLPLQEPDDLRAMKRPRLLYAGPLESWFDWETVIAGARALPTAQVAIVGHGGKIPPSLPPNIFLLGRKPHTEIAAYMRFCDVGLIPFKTARAGTIDPLKIWEYLASGMPVVASRDLSLPTIEGSVWKYGGTAEFVASILEATTAGRPSPARPEVTDRAWPEIVARLQAALHTWDR